VIRNQQVLRSQKEDRSVDRGCASNNLAEASNNKRRKTPQKSWYCVLVPITTLPSSRKLWPIRLYKNMGTWVKWLKLVHIVCLNLQMWMIMNWPMILMDLTRPLIWNSRNYTWDTGKIWLLTGLSCMPWFGNTYVRKVLQRWRDTKTFRSSKKTEMFKDYGKSLRRHTKYLPLVK